MTISLEQRVATLEAQVGALVRPVGATDGGECGCDVVLLGQRIGVMQARIAELEEACRVESIRAHDAEVQRDHLLAQQNDLRQDWGIREDETLHDGVSRVVVERSQALFQDLRADIAFLLPRANRAGSWGSAEGARDTGCAANALVRWALGGAPPTEQERPADRADLWACQRAVVALPAHRRRPEVLARLAEYEAQFPTREGLPTCEPPPAGIVLNTDIVLNAGTCAE